VPNEGELRPAQSAAGHHEIDAGTVDESGDHGKRAGDDREVPARRQVLRHFESGGACSEENGLAIVDEFRRLLPDPALLVGLHVTALGERGLGVRVVDADSATELLRRRPTLRHTKGAKKWGM